MSQTERYIELEIPTELRQKGAPAVKYVVYTRVSTDKQATERQRDGLNAYLKTMPRNWSHAGHYEDHSSGKNFSREEYKKMLAAIRKREAKVIVVWDMSRFARSMPDFHAEQQKMIAMGAHLYLVKEHLVITPEDNAFQNLMCNLLTAVHQFGREAIVENTREGMAARAKLKPFSHYGQYPKIRGRQWRTLVHMYYAKKDDPKRGAGKQTYAFTLADIAKHFNVTKPAVSDIIGKHVKLGTLKLRSPDMRRKVGSKATSTMLEIPTEHTRPSALKEKSLAQLLHPKYWPEEIREKVAKKYGSRYAKNQSQRAYAHGVRLYREWLSDTAQSAGAHAEQVSIRAIVPGSKIDSKAEFVKALELALEVGYSSIKKEQAQ